MINPEHIEEFQVLAECLNFTIAARRLYISQSTLSKHVAALENEVGCRLIDRTPSVALTPAGLLFYEETGDFLRRFREDMDNIVRKVAAHNVRTIRAPDFSGGLDWYAPSLLRTADELSAETGVDFRVSNQPLGYESLGDSLASGCYGPYSFCMLGDGGELERYTGEAGLRATWAGVQPMTLMVPTADPLALRQSVRPEDLDGRALLWGPTPAFRSVCDEIIRVLSTVGVTLYPKILIRTPQDSFLSYEDLNYDGTVTFLPRLNKKTSSLAALTPRPLEGLDMTMRVYALRPAAEADPAVERFVDRLCANMAHASGCDEPPAQ